MLSLQKWNSTCLITIFPPSAFLFYKFYFICCLASSCIINLPMIWLDWPSFVLRPISSPCRCYLPPSSSSVNNRRQSKAESSSYIVRCPLWFWHCSGCLIYKHFSKEFTTTWKCKCCELLHYHTISLTKINLYRTYHCLDLYTSHMLHTYIIWK